MRRPAACGLVLAIGVGPVWAQAPAVSLTAYATPGPVQTSGHTEGPGCTIFRPPTQMLGLKTPIVLWGNGTGTTPAAYAQRLTRLASYGFVVAAANTANAGRGREMLACLDWLA